MKGSLDIFAFKPSLRASKNSDKLATPPGLIATLIIFIVSCIFLSNKSNRLTSHHGANYSQKNIENYYYDDKGWSFYPGTDDEETKYDFLLAFGVYNATDFKSPSQVERLG